MYGILFVSASYAQTNNDNLFKPDLLHESIISQINFFRIENGYEPLTFSNQLKEVAGSGAHYSVRFGKSVEDPNFVKNMERVFGRDVYSSSNTNLGAYWVLNSVGSWENVESRMAEGYLLGVKQDNMTHSLLKSYQSDDPCYKGYIGVNSVIANETVFMNIVIYFTCSAID